MTNETMNMSVTVEDLFNTALDFYHDVVLVGCYDDDEAATRAMFQVMGILSAITALTGESKWDVADEFDNLCREYNLTMPALSYRLKH